MRNKPRYHQKGSVIVMVVGLLVMLAMIGTTFIIIAYMDRREAHSIATAAPMKQVAEGVLQQIRAKLAADLHIDITGVIYGDAGDDKQQVDYPHEDYDPHLASFAPVMINGFSTWKHITNIYGAPAGDVEDILANNGDLVDTDGYLNDDTNAGDAKLFRSRVTNISGNEYYVAVRIIDASSLININSAYSTSAAVGGIVMPITNISLEELTNTATRNNVHDARNGPTSDNIATFYANYVRRPLNPNPPGDTYRPFDISDMLALTWGRGIPDTASGRMWEALKLDGTGKFGFAKPYLTVHSASRNYVHKYTGPPPAIPGNMRLTHRVNLNSTAATVLNDLFKAFYNAIPAGVTGLSDGATPAEQDRKRRETAAQLAVNVMDFKDSDNDVTVAELNAAGDIALDDEVAPIGTIIYGIERQPFITEAWLRLEWIGDAMTGGVQQWSAIELFNPYKSDISLTGYKLKVGAGAAVNLPNLPPGAGNILSAGARIVIVNKTAEIQAASKYQDGTLDLRKTCTLFRPAGGASSAMVPIGSIGEFGLADPTAPADPPVSTAIRRDDAVARAKYSVAVSKSYDINDVTYRIGEAGCPSVDETNLGRSNVDPFGTGADDPLLRALTVAPTPVFVRNDKLINLGDVLRIFYVGPSSSDVPLDKALALMLPNDVSNGRLYTYGAIVLGTDPQIPCACMLGEYMDVLAPDPNNTGRTDTVYGRININTAPWQVIRYLPGISAFTSDIGGGFKKRDRIAKDIVAYRDLLNNTAIGGTDYSILVAPRFTATGLVLVNLREDEGFVGSGEVAIPLAKIVTPRPRNSYGAFAPNCYKITDSGTGDDGLGEITGDLSKYDIYYSWLSNQITVRSDVYIAYIRVQIGDSLTTTGPVRRYIAVIDRSNCTSADDLPDVLMFAPLK